MTTLAPDDNISSQMITFRQKMITLAPDELSYHLGRNVIILDEMLSSGANVIIWYKMLS
jgi:hypothetical protein